ncbi:MAG: ATP-binding cassette domain-containing protein [Methanobrevibacter ruminantium]|uniref:ATP-binding cassette domain-containing protein n=1 Tax=Methanobrevibacter ruminantium TaxID=83816 RepID=UPI0026ED4D06|nr:ATP-binding cassette domain-containing protein [Methanobrevibacter ruminantium]MCI5736888.1 ATP-binding cassette domain-containing protein [Methanobrevibacter ruminantium]MDD6049237.1 ATP-binding cassette domain-containing protein [Methanobrevibacter ruminantium]MDO5842842.1 ATP-binding cassette domain-containing protein [Methanobrevibacter ruminantium]
MISIKNLSKSYKLENGEEVKALNNINLEVKEGEIVGILGTSGSGKTTLLRILRGVEKFDEGEVRVERYTLKPDSTQFYFNQVKKETAIHLQRSFGIWPETVLDNVVRKLYGAKYGDEAGTDFELAHDQFDKEAYELLELVGLKEKSGHLASVLSGGEKQRLIMARQLAKKPKVMLLDEPATMACPKTKQEILDAVKKINEELNITIVLVSHLPEVHKFLAERVILLEDGEIAKDGDVDEIIDEFLSDIEDPVDIELESTDETLIKACDLDKRFYLLKGKDVLHMKDISFEVKRGDILSLVGPSGAGKTILLRMLGGMDVPDNGDVLFKLDKDGETKWVDIRKASLDRMEVRRNIGFMHQEFALVYWATVQSQLAKKLGYKRFDMVQEAKERAKEEGLPDILLDALYQLTDLPEREAKARLEQVGLEPSILDELFPKFPEAEIAEQVADLFEALDLPLDILGRRSFELSGGQKVRAMLALVLVSKPDILLLDEPFGDLDPKTLRTVTNSLKRICKEFGTTIVMVSHNTDFIRELSNRAIFIDQGLLKDDTKDVDRLVDDFIGFCKADYLM